MRPQDIVILLRLVSHWYGYSGDKYIRLFVPPVTAKQLSQELKISPAEVGHSIRRSQYAGLLLKTGMGDVARQALYEFLVYGIRLVFPVQPGRSTRGVPTAHSAPPLNQIIQADPTEQYVWPYKGGTVRGQAIEPLFHTVPEIVGQDERFYQMLALTDALRLGRSREVNLARENLSKLLGVKP
jgi:hypothetical protein